MTATRHAFLPLTAGLLAFSCGMALANDERVGASIGVGLANIRAHETVFSGDHKLSQLEWQSKAVQVLRGSLDIDVGSGWSVKLEGKTGINGNGHMVDYDWLVPGADWTHRSEHDDTGLDHYYNGSVEVNRLLFGDSLQNLSVGIGGRYTDVKWTARGGDFVYSVDSFRDTIGSFTSGVAGISYQQKIPVLYATLNGEQTMGRFRLTGALEVGAVIRNRSGDDHWLRNLRVDDSFKLSPMFGAKAGIEYSLTQNIALYLDGSFEATKFRRGDAEYADTTGNSYYEDGAGGGFSAGYIGTGVRGSF